MFEKTGLIFLKIGLHGKSGVGKTRAALAMAEKLGKVAVIDTEHGTDFIDLDFDVLHTSSIDTAIDSLESPEIAKYDVIVIDSITDLWYSAKESDWMKYIKLIRLMTDLPIHVILVARGENKMVAGPGTESHLHVVARIENGTAHIEKDRSLRLPTRIEPEMIIDTLLGDEDG